MKLFLLYSILINFGEERFINNSSKTINSIPRHIALVLTKEPFSMIFQNLLKFIYWNILLKVKYITIYDPFNVLNEKDLLSSFLRVFVNFRIAFNIRGKTYDSKKEKYITSIHENVIYDIVISVINFREGNHEIYKNIDQNREKESIIYPKTMEYFKSLYINDKENAFMKNCNDPQSRMKSVLTKKEKEYLPELILISGSSEMCLYGFLFTVIENSELIRIGKLSSINVLKFIETLCQYNKIDKRFGK